MDNPAYTTPLGTCHHADALDFLRRLPDESVSLVLTSPPYALRRKKAYGNVGESDYVEWFLPFAHEIHRILRPDGSFVFEVAPAWRRGTGTRSLFLYELILKLCQDTGAVGNGICAVPEVGGLESGPLGDGENATGADAGEGLVRPHSTFHLVQEFYWHNPSRLPTPAEYVTIRRTRVKDAVNVVWWLSKSHTPRADNRRVLRAYSKSMHRLFREGVRKATRPSEHKITDGFDRDNGGAIPDNLLQIANTTSRDGYLDRCKEAGLPIHPARFPSALPDFFVRFLTEEGDLVVDPFAGSNVTGFIAEQHNRRWLACEINADYVAGSRLRFADQPVGV